MKTDKMNSGILITLLPVISILTVILSGIIKGCSGIQIAKLSILTLIFTSAGVFFIRIQKEDILNRKYSKVILVISYLLSILLIMLPLKPDIFSFWMIGGFIASMLIDHWLGLIIYLNLTFIISVALSLHPEKIIQFLIMGIMIVLLSDALKQKSTAIYAGIIILSVNVTLAFVLNNFIFETNSNFDYLNSSLSILAVLVAAFLFSEFYNKMVLKTGAVNAVEETAEPADGVMVNADEETGEVADGVTVNADESAGFIQKINTCKEVLENDAPNQINTVSYSRDSEKADNQTVLNKALYEEKHVQKRSLRDEVSGKTDDTSIKLSAAEIDMNDHSDSSEEEEAHEPYRDESRTSYELLLEENNSLLIRVKEYSEELFDHLIKIGNISMRAAHLIGADETLAKAGGLYHEVGKISGGNYIEENLKLADEYSFPKELKIILRQHNIKHEKPTSIEAAIVMLSDNIASTMEYIKKTGDKRYTADKIIDNIFQMRMEKGTFDESGLTVKDFKILKEFYTNEFKTI